MRLQLLLLLLFGSAWACVNLSDPTTWAGNIVNVSTSNRSFYVINNITLCRQDVTIPTIHPLFIVNQSNTVIDLNGSTLRGTGLGKGVLSRHNGTVIRNGAFENFANAISIFDIDDSSATVGLERNFSDSSISSVAVDQDGNYIIGGLYDLSSGNPSLYVAKLFPNGSIVWEWKREATVIGTESSIKQVAVDQQGNIIAVGFDSEPGSRQIFAIKLNATGSEEWTWSKDISPGADYANSVAVDRDGNYILVGVDYSVSRYGMVAIKLSSSGSELWNWSFIGPVGIHEAVDVAVDADNNYVIVGSGSSSLGNFEMRIVKLSNAGNTLFNVTINPTAGYNILYSVAVDHDGNYVCVGLADYKGALIKLYPNGSQVYIKYYDIEAGSEQFVSVAVDQDNNYVIGGDGVSSLGINEWFILKTLADGTQLFNYSWSFDPDDGFMGKVAVDFNGDIIAVGNGVGSSSQFMEVLELNTNKRSLTGVLLSNISVYDSNMSTFVALPNANAALINTTFGYNETVGKLRYSSVPAASGLLANNMTLLLRPDFVSLKENEAPSFSTNAEITLFVPNCSAPQRYAVYRLAGFPQSRDEIIAGGSIYAATNKVCLSESLLTFGVASFSGYALNETTAPPPSTGGGSSKRHALSIIPVGRQYTKVNEPLLLPVSIENIGDYTERNIAISLEPQNYILAENSTIKELESGYSANSTIRITGLKPGVYLLRVLAVSDSGAGGEAEFEFEVLPQCISDLQCKPDEYCENGICSKLKCEGGVIENNKCVYYECINDSECGHGRRCIEHECVDIICGRFEKLVANECRPIQVEVDLLVSNITIGEEFVVFVLLDGIKTSGVPVLVKYPDGVTQKLMSVAEGTRVRALKAGTYVFSIEEMPERTKRAYAYEMPAVEPQPPAEIPQNQTQEQQKCCLLGVCLELFGICWYYWVLGAIAALVIFKMLLLRRKNKQKPSRYSR